MSFYTSLDYYPLEPIACVSGASIASVCDRVASSGVIERSRCRMSLRFADGSGPMVRHDLTIMVTEYVGVTQFAEDTYDREDEFETLDEMSRALHAINRPICAAMIDLGLLDENIGKAICDIDPRENECGFVPDKVSIQLDTLQLGTLAGASDTTVYTISLGVHGNGYLYPMSVAEVVANLEAIPAMREIAEACRRAWPCSRGWRWGTGETG